MQGGNGESAAIQFLMIFKSSAECWIPGWLTINEIFGICVQEDLVPIQKRINSVLSKVVDRLNTIGKPHYGSTLAKMTDTNKTLKGSNIWEKRICSSSGFFVQHELKVYKILAV